jgi:hypothetical protein
VVHIAQMGGGTDKPSTAAAARTVLIGRIHRLGVVRRDFWIWLDSKMATHTARS